MRNHFIIRTLGPSSTIFKSVVRSLTGTFLLAGSIITTGSLFSFSADASHATINEQQFRLADRNNDQRLSLAEFDEYVIALFSSLDVDKDRYLDATELKSSRSVELSSFDVNLDKRLSFKELMRSAHQNYKSADKNEDKVLTLTEVNVFSKG